MKSILELELLAKKMRGKIVENAHVNEIPHLGSCLSCVDILVTLYFKYLNIDPKNANDFERDRFLLSKGHAAPALFFVMAEAGFFPPEALQDFGSNGSFFHEHPPAPGFVPGIEAATGSLGHGLPIAAGFALAGKIRKSSFHSYVLLSDGECNEGSVWESALFISANQLTNITVLVDLNKWQATGRTDEILLKNSLKSMWSSFGWKTVEVNGNDIAELDKVLEKLSKNRSKPVAIIANTTKGKGVSFMEDDNNWHYKIPNEIEVNLAKKELGVI
ncbi:transketolase [Candidatus Ponderosibacter sp. Uisw_141_02]|uniref:transketolase n=1 Tax=Candidatus Ponderosibacter sp. Uisw_141_02 TaxID=3231000 RepID=UPI003D45DF13